MRLDKYDGKCVRIIDNYGGVYEGYCTYNNHEYCFDEFGRDEDCLQIVCILFYRSDIKKIMSLENRNGAFGKFTEPYGEIEKMIVDDIDLIEEAFESEENEHIYRILRCLKEKKLDSKVIVLLKKLIRYNEDDKIIKKANELIEGAMNENNSV